jgi:hypothetical protein
MGRDAVLDDAGAGEAETLERAKKERPVLPIVETRDRDWTADSDTEIVGNLRRLRASAGGNGVECGILGAPKQVSMKNAGAALRDSRHVTGIAELRWPLHALHLDVRKRLRRREGVGEGRVGCHIRSGDPVHTKLRLRPQTALNAAIPAVVGLHAGQDAEQ